MDLEGLLLSIENIDESMRSLNLEILKLKQNIKLYQNQQFERVRKVLLDVDKLKDLQKRQEDNNKILLQLITNS